MYTTGKIKVGHYLSAVDWKPLDTMSAAEIRKCVSGDPGTQGSQEI